MILTIYAKLQWMKIINKEIMNQIVCKKINNKIQNYHGQQC